MKVKCKLCNKRKEESEFYHYNGYRRRECKVCSGIYKKKHQQRPEIRTKTRAYMRKYMRERYRVKGTRGLVSKGTSHLGRTWEKYALKILPGSIDANKYNFHGKYDLVWRGQTVDVKVRNRRANGSYGFTTKPNPTADLYLLFCIFLRGI